MWVPRGHSTANIRLDTLPGHKKQLCTSLFIKLAFSIDLLLKKYREGDLLIYLSLEIQLNFGEDKTRKNPKDPKKYLKCNFKIIVFQENVAADGFTGLLWTQPLGDMPHRGLKTTYCKLGFVWPHVCEALSSSFTLPTNFILLGSTLTIFWLFFGFKSPVAWGWMVPPPRNTEEVAVIWGTVILIVLVPAVCPGQGQGPLPPGSPVRSWDWPAGFILCLLIFFCFRVRTVDHFYGDLRDSEQARSMTSCSSWEEGLRVLEKRMAASLVKESCSYMVIENARHPGMARMNSMTRRSMASDRQEARHDWVLGLLITKLLISLSLKEHCLCSSCTKITAITKHNLLIRCHIRHCFKCSVHITLSNPHPCTCATHIPHQWVGSIFISCHLGWPHESLGPIEWKWVTLMGLGEMIQGRLGRWISG